MIVASNCREYNNTKNETTNSIVPDSIDIGYSASDSILIASPVFKISVADFFNSDTNLLLHVFIDWTNLECNFKPDSDAVADCFDSDGNIIPKYLPDDNSYELDTEIKMLTSRQFLDIIKNSKYVSPFVPMSFAIYENMIYIPYSAAQKIVKYSMHGEKMEDIYIECIGDPVHCFIDYIEVLENGNILINNFYRRDLLEITQENGAIIERREAPTMKISKSYNNYFFNTKRNSVDAQNQFSDDIKFRWNSDATESFDYIMQDSLLVIMQFEKDTKSINIIKGKEIESKEVILPSNLMNMIQGLHFLYIKNNEIFFILQDNNFNGDRFVKYNLITEKFSIYSLFIDYDKEIFIPSERLLWPNGVIYSRFIDYKGKKAIFALFMDKEYINFYKFDIDTPSTIHKGK